MLMNKLHSLIIGIISLSLLGCYSEYRMQERSPAQAVEKTVDSTVPYRETEPKGGAAPSAAVPAPSTPKPPPTPPRIDFTPDGIQKAPAQNTLGAQAESIVRQLFSASMVFSVPTEVNIEEDAKVQLIIDPSKEVADIEKNITVKGAKTGQTIKISKVIIASISAPNFDVTQVTPEEQVISSDSPTEWLWSLKPKTTGEHSVNVTITAIVSVDGKERKHHIKTFDKTVTVVVKPQQVATSWAEDNWEWLFSTLVIPIGAWAWNKKQT